MNRRSSCQARASLGVMAHIEQTNSSTATVILVIAPVSPKNGFQFLHCRNKAITLKTPPGCISQTDVVSYAARWVLRTCMREIGRHRSRPSQLAQLRARLLD